MQTSHREPQNPHPPGACRHCGRVLRAGGGDGADAEDAASVLFCNGRGPLESLPWPVRLSSGTKMGASSPPPCQLRMAKRRHSSSEAGPDARRRGQSRTTTRWDAGVPAGEGGEYEGVAPRPRPTPLAAYDVVSVLYRKNTVQGI